jgi:hypothetical protein
VATRLLADTGGHAGPSATDTRGDAKAAEPRQTRETLYSPEPGKRTAAPVSTGTSQAAQLVAQCLRSYGTDVRPLAAGCGQGAEVEDAIVALRKQLIEAL